MTTSKTNCHTAVINARLGRPLWLVHAQYVAPWHWSRCWPKGRSRAYTHKLMQQVFRISPQEMWLGTTNLRTGRDQSVTENIFLSFWFCLFLKGSSMCPSLHRINSTTSLFSRLKSILADNGWCLYSVIPESFHCHLHNLTNRVRQQS